MIFKTVFFTLAMSALSLPASAAVVIGVAGPMTGAFAPVGLQIKAGVERAVNEINAAGGLNGEELVIEAVDDKCEAKTAEAVANQLVGKGARLVVGHVCTAAAIPAATVYAANNIVLISPAATNPRFTDEKIGPGIYRLAPRSDQQEQVLGAYLKQNFGSTRVGFVHDGSVYGQGFVDAVRTGYEASGAKAVLTEAFVPGEKSQITLAGKLQDAALSAVVIGGLQADAAVIAAEIRGRGLSAVILGNEVLGLQEFADIAGPAAEGVIFTLPKSYRDLPEAATMSAALIGEQIDPSNVLLASYAAVGVWFGAAMDDPGGALAGSQLQMGGRSSVIGSIGFDDKGDWTGAGYELYVWRNGAPVPLK